MAISGFESDGKEGVLYRKWMKELNEEELEDDMNGLWEESMEVVRGMAVDGETEGLELGVRDSGMSVDIEGDKNEGDEENVGEDGKRMKIKKRKRKLRERGSKQGMRESALWSVN